MVLQILATVSLSTGFFSGYSQEVKPVDIPYTIIVEGTDSPIEQLSIICYNKYFNVEYLPVEFREKYELGDKAVYKGKILLEIFWVDTDNTGIDKIQLNSIRYIDKTIVIDYSVINSDSSNDEEVLAPFLIAQLPRSRHPVRFLVDGEEVGESTGVYVD